MLMKIFVYSGSIPQMPPLFMQNNSDDTNSIIPEQMKKYLLILLLTAQALTAGAQDYPEYQFSFGWGGYPAYEWMAYEMPFSDCELAIRYIHPDLRDIYRPYHSRMYSSGTFSGRFAINFKKWFTLSFDLAANLVWQNEFDAVSDRRNGSYVGFMIHAVPNARFNWLNREKVRMYSTIGLGFMTGKDAESSEFLILPSAQINPVGIEVGRKLFGFCELGAGTLFTGAMAGIGYRF